MSNIQTKTNDQPLVCSGSPFFKMDSIIKKARKLLEQEFSEAGIDLTADQWVIIDRVHEAGQISQHLLAQESFKDAGTTTRILDLLCKKNYTVRLLSATDRRSFEIRLTEAGRKMYGRARLQSSKVKSKGFGSLSAKQLNLLNELLDHIYLHVSQPDL